MLVLHHPVDLRDHRAAGDLHASGDTVTLEQQRCQCVGFLACAIQYAFQQIVIRRHQLFEALEGCRVGNVDQVQRGLLRIAQVGRPLSGVAGMWGKVGGNQYVFQRVHVGLLGQGAHSDQAVNLAHCAPVGT
ncbi:hypothetical protein D3C80_1361550 [compost metagenome]